MIRSVKFCKDEVYRRSCVIFLILNIENFIISCCARIFKWFFYLSLDLEKSGTMENEFRIQKRLIVSLERKEKKCVNSFNSDC